MRYAPGSLDSALDKKPYSLNPASMPKRKKSKKRSKAKSNVIVVLLPSDTEFDKSMKSIKDQMKVGFEIEDIHQDLSMPVVRAKNHPVQL